MLKVVLDTNLIVSGAISRRASPYELLEAWRRGEFVLVTSSQIIQEVVEVLGRDRLRSNYGITDERIARIRRVLEVDALMVQTRGRLQVVEDDPDDNRILEAALAGEADYVASGDRHLLRLGRYRHIGIVTASELLDILRSSG